MNSFCVGLVIGSFALISTSLAAESKDLPKLPSCDAALKNIYRAAGFGDGSNLPPSAAKNTYSVEMLNRVRDEISQLAKNADLRFPVEPAIEKDAIKLWRDAKVANDKAQSDNRELQAVNAIIKESDIPGLTATNKKLAARQRTLQEIAAKSKQRQTLANQNLTAFRIKHAITIDDRDANDVRDPIVQHRNVAGLKIWSDKNRSPDYFDYGLIEGHKIRFENERRKPVFDSVTVIREQKDRTALETAIEALKNERQDFRDKLHTRKRLEALKSYDAKLVDKDEIDREIKKLDQELALSGTPEQIEAAIKYYDQFSQGVSLTVFSNKGKVVGAIVDSEKSISYLGPSNNIRGFVCTGDAVAATMTSRGELVSPDECLKNWSREACQDILDVTTFPGISAPPPAHFDPPKPTTR